MFQAHTKLIQSLELNLVVKQMRNKLNCNLVGCLRTLLQKVLDDCTFSTVSTFSFDPDLIIFHQLHGIEKAEKVIKLATLLAIGAFLFRVDDCTF